MSINHKQLIKNYRVPFRAGFRLDRIDPADESLFRKKEKERVKDLLAEDAERLNDLQQILYAQGQHAVLVVLQGMDTAGKDGTIRHVMGPLNPQGVRVATFKKPTDLEFSHDFLWRVHQVVPPTGFIGIFNRSHYEDILVPTVWNTFPPEIVAERYGQINDFEKHLTANSVTILKFFLHISKDEQKERLQARLDTPHKNWKFARGDLETRARWDQFQKTYESILGRCSKPWAPGYVIPANRKWYRNFLVARILRRTLEELDLRYPPAEEGLEDVVIPD